MNQSNAPLYEALEKHRAERIVHFDVPGHKGGRGNKELTDFLGEKCLKADVNSMKSVDNLNHPVSVIKDARNWLLKHSEPIAAFIVNGTTSAVQAMVMSACKQVKNTYAPQCTHKCYKCSYFKWSYPSLYRSWHKQQARDCLGYVDC